MDITRATHMLSVEVSELDLGDLAVGQVVEIVTDKHTFWVARLTMSGVHGQEHGAVRFAITGTDFASGNPKSTSCTRKLKIGGDFHVVSGDQPALDSKIEHILLLRDD